MPERRRVLGARHRDVHDPGRHLHPPLRLLQRPDGQADLERPLEPARVARSIARMGLRHAVITSVDRDDLPDYGAGIWAATIRQVRRQAPDCQVEVLTPDFRGQEMPLAKVIAERPDVFNHNARDRTILSAYSVRGRPDATVSAPVRWDELPDVEMEDFTIATMPPRSQSSATCTTGSTTRCATCVCCSSGSSAKRRKASARRRIRRTSRRCPASRSACSRASEEESRR